MLQFAWYAFQIFVIQSSFMWQTKKIGKLRVENVTIDRPHYPDI